MRTDFEFSNVLGGTYTNGNLCFTNDGRTLLSPISNRVAVYDLAQNRNVALPFEADRNIVLMDLSKEEDLLVVGDELGQVTFVHFPSSTRLESCWLTSPQTTEPPVALKLSPDGNFFCAAISELVEVWTTPRPRIFQFKSVFRVSRITVCSSPARSITWFCDSHHLAIGYEDHALRLMPKVIPNVNRIDRMRLANPVYRLMPLKAPIAGVFFVNEKNTDLIYLSADATIVRAILDEKLPLKSATVLQDQIKPKKGGDGLLYSCYQWQQGKPNYLPNSNGLKGISSLDYNAGRTMLAVGFRAGKFILYTINTTQKLECVSIQEMTISAQTITSTILNPTGDWLAVGSRKLGQVVVWDWKSETYVLRQQAHQATDIACLAYSYDGSVVATGGEDGKVKGWKGAHSYCFVTFTEHTAAIVDVKFNSTNSLFSASLDGTIRAFDMNRYRHYRVVTTPTPVQFSCIALDPSGEVLAAGCSDKFDVYVWSAKSGRILEVLSGHEGPVSRLHFSPVENVLVSSSWDKTLKVWPMFLGDQRTKESSESLPLMSEVLFVCFNNAGNEMAALTLAGVIEFFDTKNLKEVKQSRGGIDVKLDIQGGFILEEMTKPYSKNAGRYVDTAAYTANDTALLVAGYTKFICMYDTTNRLLLRRWAVSRNLSLDGVREVYDWRSQTEAGNRHLIDYGDGYDHDGQPIELPGVEGGKAGSVGKRLTRPVARTKYITFAPSGREWAAATTAGLLIYSLDGAAASFRPLKLEYNLTPQQVYQTLKDGSYGQALQQALQLNVETVLRAVVNGVPTSHIEFVAGLVPTGHLGQMLELIAAELQRSQHFEFCLQWALQLQLKHAVHLERQGLMPQLKDLARVISGKAMELKSMSDTNVYGMRYVQCLATLQQRQEEMEEWPESEEIENDDNEDDHNDEAPDMMVSKQPEGTSAKKRKTLKRKGSVTSLPPVGDAADAGPLKTSVRRTKAKKTARRVQAIPA